MLIAERIDAFKAAFPNNPAAWPWLAQEQGRDVLYATWLCGNDFSNIACKCRYNTLPYGNDKQKEQRAEDRLLPMPGVSAASGTKTSMDQTGEESDVFASVQQHAQGPGVGETRLQGTRGLESRNREKVPSADDRFSQPKLEGWPIDNRPRLCDGSNERETRERQDEVRLRTSASNGEEARSKVTKHRDRPSHRRQSVQQRDRESGAVLFDTRSSRNSSRRSGICQTCGCPLTPYYGAHPKGYLDKLLALFPDVIAETRDRATSPILHAFAGSMSAGPWERLDIRSNLVDGVVPDVVGSVYRVSELFGARRFALITADPPYSDADAARYGSPMIDRLRTTEALADVAVAGGHLAWLDTCWPQHSKEHWITVGRVQVIRSTNHRFRGMTLFERTADGG